MTTVKVFAYEDTMQLCGYADDDEDLDTSEYVDVISADIPPAQLDWIDDCFKKFADCQEYLRSVLEREEQ